MEADLDQMGQIKSRERVRDLAEVYTHVREVDAMLALVKDALEAAGVAFERIDRLGDSDRPHVMLLDDFVGVGSRTAGIVRGWLGDGSGARPIPGAAQDRLRHSTVLCAYATGLPAAEDHLEPELAGCGVQPKVHIQSPSPPTLDTADISSQFRATLQTLGAELLRQNKGYAQESASERPRIRRAWPPRVLPVGNAQAIGDSPLAEWAKAGGVLAGSAPATRLRRCTPPLTERCTLRHQIDEDLSRGLR